MRRFKAVVLVVMFLFLGLSVVTCAFAEEPRKDVALPETPMPDLLVHSAIINPVPVLGENIGKVVIAISNRGKADSAETELRLNCMAENCEQPMDCNNISQSMNAVIPLKSLKTGEMAAVEWVPVAPVKWVSGEFTLVTVVDYENLIKENDEANNIRKESISMSSLKPMPAPVQAVAPAAAPAATLPPPTAPKSTKPAGEK
ncbi:MAG: CARDB domain-containing protein [Candidatus Omnitrophota bacterium]